MKLLRATRQARKAQAGTAAQGVSLARVLDEPGSHGPRADPRLDVAGSQAAATLDAANSYNRRLIEASLDPLVTIGADGKITDVNEATVKVTGVAREALIGTDFCNYFTDAKLARAGYRQAFEKGFITDYALTIRHTSGRTTDVLYNATVYRNGAGEIKGVFAAARDITVRQRAEDQRAAAEKRARELLTASNESRLALLSVVEDHKQAAEALQARTDEISSLYLLSRALAAANSLTEALDIVTRHAVENFHVTLARIALVEGEALVVRAAYPARVLNHDLLVEDRKPITALPHCAQALGGHEAVLVRAGALGLSGDERESLLLDFTPTVCLIPLRVGDSDELAGDALGLLMLSEARSEERAPFTTEKIREAQSMGDQAATTIRRILLREQTQRRLKQVLALRKIDEAISGSFDLRTVLSIVLDETTTQLGVDAASVVLLDPFTQTLEYFTERGFRSDATRRAPVYMSESYAGRVALERELIQVPRLRDDPRAAALGRLWPGEDFTCYYGVPLVVKGRVRGVLEILHRSELQPDPEWLEFLKALARQAAIEIENFDLFESLQRSNAELAVAYDATIEGWSHALDLRDEETQGHTLRVTEMTVRLGRDFGLSEAELVQVRWGSLLHDIGKMGVPDRILLKPGPLTDEEWVIMKKHPVFAHEMLSPIRYLRLALDIPYCHHEKWDGSGYPRGLKGDQIPLVARIFAAVDVWDALISDRPYRKAWSPEEAMRHIRAGAGSHFDPEVVAALLGQIPAQEP